MRNLSNGTNYDEEEVISFLSKRDVLAQILRCVTEEFCDMTFEKIKDRIIRHPLIQKLSDEGNDTGYQISFAGSLIGVNKHYIVAICLGNQDENTITEFSFEKKEKTGQSCESETALEKIVYIRIGLSGKATQENEKKYSDLFQMLDAFFFPNTTEE